MRIVLDTSVLVSAFRSPSGASRAVLRLVAAKRLRLAASSALYFEYENVLTRPEQIVAHGISQERVVDFLFRMTSFTEQVRIHWQYKLQLRDPNDEMVLEAAINAGTHFIVTHNVKDFFEPQINSALKLLHQRVFLVCGRVHERNRHTSPHV